MIFRFWKCWVYMYLSYSIRICFEVSSLRKLSVRCLFNIGEPIFHWTEIDTDHNVCEREPRIVDSRTNRIDEIANFKCWMCAGQSSRANMDRAHFSLPLLFLAQTIKSHCVMLTRAVSLLSIKSRSWFSWRAQLADDDSEKSSVHDQNIYICE